MAPINSTELSDIIMQVLTRLDIPVSITLINTTLLSLCKMKPITEKFLLDNTDKFLLQVLGCDLKILLRKPNTKKIIGDKASEICSIIERDIRKLNEIEKSLKEDNEILYDILISRYSSRKKNINISFIVRNSHILDLYCRDKQTYVRFVNKNENRVKMKDDEIVKILRTDGFQDILVLCLKNLLFNVSFKVNLGSLQASFSFGNMLIDNRFLHMYSNIFKCSSVDSTCYIELEPEARKEIDEIALTKEACDDPPDAKSYVMSDKSDIFGVQQESSLNFASNIVSYDKDTIGCGCKNSSTKDKKELLNLAQDAIDSNKSLIIVGETDSDPLMLDLLPNDSNYRLSVLKNMLEAVSNEIERIKN